MKSFDEEWEHLEYGFCNLLAINPESVIFVIWVEGEESCTGEGVCFVTDLLGPHTGLIFSL